MRRPSRTLRASIDCRQRSFGYTSATDGLTGRASVGRSSMIALDSPRRTEGDGDLMDDRPLAAWLHIRYHGDLGSIMDSERRGLRPVGATVREAAGRTGDLLAGFVARQTVHIFHGVYPAGEEAPRIPHAISAGRHVVFIESVTWPSGRYAVEGGHQVYCDDIYTGQSVRCLIDAVHRWRHMLPPNHCVSALVVVHPLGDGPVVLPAQPSDVAWTLPQHVTRDLWGLMPTRRQVVSQAALVALAAASEASSTSPWTSTRTA